MPIEEKAIIGALAEVLSARPDVHATAELTRRRTGGKRCDVEIRRKHNDRHYTAVECKIGRKVTQRKAAVKDAQRWLKQLDCWNAVALCYPEEVAERRKQTVGEFLTTTDELVMTRVGRDGTVGKWRRGGLGELASLASDAGASETYVITQILENANRTASEDIGPHVGRDLAVVLELPWDPKKGIDIDPRPGRIACLIVANMALLHNRMRSEGVGVAGLASLVSIKNAQSRLGMLVENWRRIRAVDYAPVVDPALAVLERLPADNFTESILGTLIDAVLACAPRIRGLRLDHAGPLYHGLLQTARYDGSFYTSTAAAVLLAELAMPDGWLGKGGNWADHNGLARLKICDPACGTGTLLMAAARCIEERFREAGGREAFVEELHLSLIEDVLNGLDINQHAVHLAACMLTLSAPKIDYNRMNLFNMRHGVTSTGEVRAGSLDILVDNAWYLPADAFAPSGDCNVMLRST